MLIITRKVGKSLMIGEEPIIITVLNVKGKHVRLGIKADKNTAVDREEIYEAKKAQHQACC